MSFFGTLIPARGCAAANQHDQTAAGVAPTVRPTYEVKETPEAFGVTVHLPGVAKDGLEVTAESGLLRILGRRAWKQPDDWTTLHRESDDAPFELVLNHENAVDTDKIAAELRDGVLCLSLPKPEAIKPRRIAIG